MNITMTLEEIMSRGIWEKVSNLKGYDYYAPREGMPSDYKFYFSEEEARELGLL